MVLPDGRWRMAYEDGVLRFIIGYDMFGHSTSINAVRVLCNAIAEHGKPTSVMTNHDVQSCANESE